MSILILTGRCNVNARDDSGKTPFLRAVSLSQLKTVEIFLNNRDIDWLAEDDEGNQATHFAAALRTRAMAQMLHASGKFDFTVKNSKNETPFAIARAHDHADCKEFFSEMATAIGFVDDSLDSDGIPLGEEDEEEDEGEEETNQDDEDEEEEKGEKEEESEAEAGEEEDGQEGHAGEEESSSSDSDSDSGDFLASHRYRHLFDHRSSSVG
jgi:ankyrin repeat protein